MKHKPVYNGEPAKIRCPLFEAFVKYNYSTAHSSGLTLIWYWIGRGQDLEEPINFRLPDNHISKEKDTLWFRPALLNDTGNYTCMLRYLKANNLLLLDAEFCTLVDKFHERKVYGVNLTFLIVRQTYDGDYTCIATYRENGRDFNLTRTFRVKVVASPSSSTAPLIRNPNSYVVYERKPDGKEYDIYVSYARNAEEEEFVLLTLRGVLENEFGYKLCIFDRDSLPGGIVTDETLSFIQRSRRLLVVLSPNYVLQGTQALLELKAGLEDMASKGTIKVILVQYRAVKRSKVKELRQAKAALTVIKWKGEKSSYPRGRFWKRLLVEMPVKSRPKSMVMVDKSKSSFPSLKDV
ncbi:hypothetical protein JD844_007784 [Phrynosoma platyrhinos]|uniref:Interleukin-1 receptor accessory protein n=1 Tax=Phrynosoma platyrhinos TaxID=52577 RepID=A0ABQ7T3L4_PHRPL|nr:hypothetical protein JD844_007784 [Phrynosoma platyrhinos]